jgi:hypothetical protein
MLAIFRACDFGGDFKDVIVAQSCRFTTTFIALLSVFTIYIPDRTANS